MSTKQIVLERCPRDAHSAKRGLLSSERRALARHARLACLTLATTTVQARLQSVSTGGRGGTTAAGTSVAGGATGATGGPRRGGECGTTRGASRRRTTARRPAEATTTAGLRAGEKAAGGTAALLTWTGRTGKEIAPTPEAGARTTTTGGCGAGAVRGRRRCGPHSRPGPRLTPQARPLAPPPGPQLRPWRPLPRLARQTEPRPRAQPSRAPTCRPPGALAPGPRPR